MSYPEEHLDQLLRASGARWRASEPELEAFSVAALVRERGKRRPFGVPLAVGAPLAGVLLAVVALFTLFVAGQLGSPGQTVAPPPASASPGASGWPWVLYLENRGGPPFTVTINGIRVANVDCGAYPTLAPGQGNVPQLPWDLLITRNANGSTIASERLTELPRWFVQIGDEPLGFSDKPLIGPVTSCPPAVPTPTSAPTPPAATAMTDPDALIPAVAAINRDTANFGGSYLDENGVMVIEYVGDNAGRAAVEQLLPPGASVRWVQVERSRAELDQVQNAIAARAAGGETALAYVVLIGLDTINNRVEVTVSPPGDAAAVADLLTREYGAAVYVISGPPVTF
jgi:hypothetical protein